MGGIGSGRRVRREPETVNQIIRLYAEGELIKNIAVAVKRDTHTVVKILKDEGVYDPEQSRENYMRCLRAANLKRRDEKNLFINKEAETKAIQRIESRGFIYLSGYENVNSFVKVQCKTCGEITERSVQPFRKGKAVCQTCRHKETLQRQAEAKRLRTIESEKKKEELEARKLEREKDKCRKFDEVFNCRVCGKEYTPRQYMESCGLTLFSNVGYCSKTCRHKEFRRKQNEANKKRGRRSDKHYRRAKKLGLPAERGITLPKLIARDGLNCAICGLVCFYEGDPKSDLYPSIDHIVPIDKGGGHVWSNAQVAHRICNSIKSNKIGVKYGNDKIYKTA